MRLRLNITAKLLGYLLLASVVPLVVLGFSALEIARRVVLEQAQAENVHLVGSFSSYLTLYHEQIEDLATNIAGNEAIGSSLRAADSPEGSSFDELNLRAQIGYALNAYIRVKGLVSLDLFSVGGNHFHVGETLNTMPVSPQMASSLMRDALASQGKTIWKGVGQNINSTSRYPRVRSIVRAIRHFSPANGKSDMVGVLVISLTDEIMQDYLSRAPLMAGQKLMLVDLNGNIALHSDRRMVGQALTTELLEIVRNERDTKRFKLDGEDVLLDSAPTKINQSYVVMVTPLGLVTDKVSRLTIATLTVLGLCLLAVGVLTWHYARIVVAPIRAVSDGFRLLHVQSDVDPSPLVRPAADDEIAQLIEGYNQHLVTLKQQREDRKELLQARKAAEAASRAKSDFLANMSHEIRTPMNAILGLLKLMQGTQMDERQVDYVKKTEGAASSLLGLLNDILDFSKVEAGKMTLDPRPFSLQRMLDDLAVVLSANMRGKRIEVRFDVDKDVPIYLLGDDMRLQQVLVNLGGNAIKFTDEGNVVVRVRAVSREEKDVLLEFAVIDTGIGIPTEKQSLIFQDFSQAESSTTRRFGGTGLGLSISRRLVELMGSQLKLESIPGKGSKFFFEVHLPTVDRSEVPNVDLSGSKDKTKQAQRLKGMRILLVEDNKINQMVAEGLLAREGAQVTVAENGQIGVQAVRQANPQFNAVLMDLQMPVMDGFEASRAIREVPELSSIPIIAMTANAMASDREACLAAGMDEHIGKPFDLDRLIELLHQFAKISNRADTQASSNVPTTSTAISSEFSTNSFTAPSMVPVEQLDIPVAIERMGGDAGLYSKALAGFLKDSRKLSSQVGNSLAKEDLGLVARELHTAKGLSGTLGATGLSHALSNLEKRAKNGLRPEEHADFLQKLDDALNHVLPLLNEVMVSSQGHSMEVRNTDKSSAEDLSAALNELEELLQNFDMAAMKKFAQIKREHPLYSGSAESDLEHAIESLDFNTALTICRSERERIDA